MGRQELECLVKEYHSLDNLRLICPNCHAQTETYKAKNMGRGRHYRRERYAKGKSYLLFEVLQGLRAGVVEWLMAPGCKPGGRQSYVGSNPTPCTEISNFRLEI